MAAYHSSMSRHTVYLVGEGMFAETLHLLLTSGEEASSITLIADFQKVLPMLQAQPPDILILVDQDHFRHGHVELAVAVGAAKHEVKQHRHRDRDHKHEDQSNLIAKGTEQVFEGDIDDFHKQFP